MNSFNSSIWERALTLVGGYHEHCYPPKTAYEAGLRYRFAIVVHSDCKNNPDESFDAELFLALVGAIQEALDFDSQAIQLNTDLAVKSLIKLTELYLSSVAREREAPQKISYYKNSSLVCEEQTEFWNLIGGPFPYHDSYAFCFYSAEDCFEQLASRCLIVGQQLGIETPSKYYGQDFRKPLSWHKWLLNWLWS